MKAMLGEIKTGISEQDQSSIEKRIRKLGELSHLFISKAYALDQTQTKSLLTEDRIGGHSIIGESIDDSKIKVLYYILYLTCNTS